jgi:trk system potassium uptake protein TrkH
MRPAALVAAGFLIAIAVGTVLLALPVAHAPGHAVSWSDALFTATSAVCVTGLVVVDTGSAFSLFGRTVIALLIQAGGLGIVTLGGLAALLVGSRVGFRQRLHLQRQVGALHVGGVMRLVRGIVLVAVVAEGALTLALWPRLAAEHGVLSGLGVAAFHAISAFNNAGFSTYQDSLSRYVGDAWIVLPILTAFVLGGVGHAVLLTVIDRLRGGGARFTLHAKMALAMTAALLAFAAIAVAALEWSNPATLGDLAWPDRLLAALFQGATPRTAGFNTVDVASLRPATLALMLLLMFVGGSPGSTAGGIKTVTFFVLAGSAWSWSRGHGELEIWGRRLTADLVARAGVIAFLGVMLVGAGFTLLLVLDPRLGFTPLLFESVSAFGTVGLSLGVTPDLSEGGRLVVVALMLVGRLGPLTAAVALLERSRAKLASYPAEDVMIG